MRQNAANARSYSYREPGAADFPAIKALAAEMTRRGGSMTTKEIGDHMRRHKRPRPSSAYEVARLITLASAIKANETRETRTRRPQDHRVRKVDPRNVKDWSKVPYSALPSLSHPDGDMARRRWLAAQRL